VSEAESVTSKNLLQVSNLSQVKYTLRANVSQNDTKVLSQNAAGKKWQRELDINRKARIQNICVLIPHTQRNKLLAMKLPQTPLLR